MASWELLFCYAISWKKYSMPWKLWSETKCRMLWFTLAIKAGKEIWFGCIMVVETLVVRKDWWFVSRCWGNLLAIHAVCGSPKQWAQSSCLVGSEPSSLLVPGVCLLLPCHAFHIASTSRFDSVSSIQKCCGSTHWWEHMWLGYEERVEKGSQLAFQCDWSHT